MNATLRLLLLAAGLGALAVPAIADDRQTTQPTDEAPKTEPAQPAPPATTMKDLLSAGYEVKAVSIIPHDMVKRGGATSDVDAAMILLQKGAAVATCYTEFASFASGAFVTLPCTEFK